MTASSVRKIGIHGIFEWLPHSRYFLEKHVFKLVNNRGIFEFLENIGNEAEFRKCREYLFFLVLMRSCVPIYSFKLSILIFMISEQLFFICENPYSSGSTKHKAKAELYRYI